MSSDDPKRNLEIKTLVSVIGPFRRGRRGVHFF